jgi:hypothetical protein
MLQFLILNWFNYEFFYDTLHGAITVAQLYIQRHKIFEQEINSSVRLHRCILRACTYTILTSPIGTHVVPTRHTFVKKKKTATVDTV